MLLETGVILLHFGFQAKFASLLSLVTKKSRRFLSLSNSDHMKLTKKNKLCETTFSLHYDFNFYIAGP